jgi:fatty acid desaturase
MNEQVYDRQEQNSARLQSPITPPREDEYINEIPDRLSANELRELSEINIWVVSRAIASEWLATIAAIWLCNRFWHPLFYLLIAMFIGARQHALAVLNHDASHYRLLPDKRWNDWIAEPLLAWPILLSTRWFRTHHNPHHRYIGTEKDGNRKLYRTHTPDGELIKFWSFPKSPIAVAGMLLFDLLGALGILYVLRTIKRSLSLGDWRFSVTQGIYYSAISTIIIFYHAEKLVLLYWFVPLCTWFILVNHLRIIADHSAIANNHPVYRLTRTTKPSWLDLMFVVPRNISYHIEHHLYPTVPFYSLPKLHARLMEHPGFQQQAHITHTFWVVLQELVQTAA